MTRILARFFTLVMIFSMESGRKRRLRRHWTPPWSIADSVDASLP